MKQAVENLKKEIVEIHNFLFPENQLEGFDLSMIGKGKNCSECTTLISFAFRLKGFLETEPTPHALESIIAEIAAFKESIRK